MDLPAVTSTPTTLVDFVRIKSDAKLARSQPAKEWAVHYGFHAQHSECQGCLTVRAAGPALAIRKAMKHLVTYGGLVDFVTVRPVTIG